MGAGPVEIINAALAEIGAPAITDLSDKTPEARAASRNYPLVRDAVLRLHPWNCAQKRDTLTSPSVTAPAWGFANAYDLPADFIRLIALEGDPFQRFRVEGLQVLSDSSEVNILYVYRLEDVSKMDTLLRQAIATRLAAQIAMTLKGSSDQVVRLFQLADAKLAEAQGIDSLEGPVEIHQPGSWLRARETFSDPFRRIEPL